MKIKVIALGSTPKERSILRWGVSFLINDKILFDTFGDAKVFFRNLKKFNVNIKKIKSVVISHEHWDHVNGLKRLLLLDNKFKVYICKHSQEAFKSELDALSANIREIEALSSVDKKIFTTGELNNKGSYPDIYEQSLVLSNKKGLVVITGCAHPGIVEMVSFIKSRFKKDIDLLLGGFHLKNMPLQTVKQIASDLKSSGIKRIAPTHCTGKNAVRIIRKEFKGSFIKLKEGDVLEV